MSNLSEIEIKNLLSAIGRGWVSGYSADECKALRARHDRLKANRVRRERHQAMTDLGLKRVRGSLGGTYYE